MQVGLGQKYLSENISLPEVMDFHRQVPETGRTEAIGIPGRYIGPDFFRQGYFAALTLGYVARLAFEASLATGA